MARPARSAMARARSSRDTTKQQAAPSCDSHGRGRKLPRPFFWPTIRRHHAHLRQFRPAPRSATAAVRNGPDPARRLAGGRGRAQRHRQVEPVRGIDGRARTRSRRPRTSRAGPHRLGGPGNAVAAAIRRWTSCCRATRPCARRGRAEAAGRRRGLGGGGRGPPPAGGAAGLRRRGARRQACCTAWAFPRRPTASRSRISPAAGGCGSTSPAR
jgi:hypothetical protein